MVSWKEWGLKVQRLELVTSYMASGKPHKC